MLAKIYSAAVHGIEAFVVTIETVVDKGTLFTIVGLPDTAVKESYTRIVSAIKESGVTYPHRRITINLAPADVKKEGAGFDLPMALGILAANENIQNPELASYMIAGELSLDGTVLPVRGVLPMAVKARQAGFRRMIVPAANATEAAVVNDVEVYGVENLAEALDLLNGKSDMKPTVNSCSTPQARLPTLPMSRGSMP
jgi:magnesium chelatase family protein